MPIGRETSSIHGRAVAALMLESGSNTNIPRIPLVPLKFTPKKGASQKLSSLARNWGTPIY